MPKASRSKPPTRPDPSEDLPLDENLPEEEEGAQSLTEPPEEGNGHTNVEDPAVMEVKIKGTARGVAAAAKKVAGGGTVRPPVAAEPEEPPPDENAALLANPKNMVVVTRQLPRVFHLRDGTEVRCATKVERYSCPVTKTEIEEDVFDRFGGRKYNCTIHPNTTTGENQILGAFTIEHPNPDEPPYIQDTTEEPPEMPVTIPGGSDPTLRETDPLARAKADLERRLERARMMKEIKDLERMVKEAEGGSDGKAAPAPPPGPDPRDREIAELKAALAKKETDERFAAMQASISELAKSVQALAMKPEKSGGEESLVLKLLNQSQQHSKEMIDLVKTIQRPVAPPPPPESENFDKMLDRLTKMKQAFGGDDSRVSKLQDQLLEMAMERVLGGGEEGGEEEDTMKFAIKQFTPVLKTYVEKQVEKEERKGGGEKKELSVEQRKKIYEEAAAKAAADLKAQWEAQGLVVRVPAPKGIPGAAKKPGLPAPKSAPPGKVVGRTKTPEGIVEHVQVEPADLSKKAAPRGNAATAEAPAAASRSEESEEVKYTDMPGIGKVEVPALPGEMKYDRKKSVNYVLDSMLSEISEGTPKRGADDPAVESFVPADALEFLDDEILAEIHKATSGEELESVLGTWGDKEKIMKIKEAGAADKAVDSWVRRLIRTIQDVWRDRQQK